MFGFLKKKKRREGVKAGWNVFNPWGPLEFAECKNCGHEEEPDYPWIDYPEVCPECGAYMVDNTLVDDA